MRHTAAFLLVVAMLTSTLPAGGSIGEELTDTPTLEAPAPLSNVEPSILGATSLPHGVIVHFHDEAPGNLGEVQGLEVRYRFHNLPAVFALATTDAIEALAQAEETAFIEDAEKPLDLHMDSASIASRAREVLDPDFEPPVFIDEPSPTQLADDGSLLDGSGIGVAIVDSGVDATHPDLADRLAESYVVTPGGVQPGGPVTDTQGHGTQVAGIALGTGAADTGDWRKGAAPGAHLYSFATWAPDARGLSTEGTVIAPAMAFDWILENGEAQDPAIRVVANAWSCRAAVCDMTNPAPAHMQLASQLAEDGVIVLFAAGDSFGKGFETRTTPECSIQTPGVLCVANYDDEEVGSRDSCIDSSSSRGHGFQPETFPDIAAPGDSVWAPNALRAHEDSRVPAGQSATNPDGERKAYVRVTGTSAATAHAAGIVALLLQTNPDLSPAEAEYVLETTAEKLEGKDRCAPYAQVDESHPDSAVSYAAGHGLVDAMDAVELARDVSGIPAMGDTEPFPDGWLAQRTVVTDTDRTFYLNEDFLTEDQPGFGAPGLHPAPSGASVSWISDPLEEGFTTTGVNAHLWFGSTAEYWVTVNAVDFELLVERVEPDGTTDLAFEDDIRKYHITPVNPVHRFEEMTREEPFTFEEGDRVKFTFIPEPNHEAAPALGNVFLYAGAQPTPSHISFGTVTQDVEPGSPEACVDDSQCTLLGGDFNYVTVACHDPFQVYSVEWTGPPGSSATASCNGAIATCTIPADLQAETGTCQAQSATKPVSTDTGQCTYTIPTTDGPAIGGQGRCSAGHLP